MSCRDLVKVIGSCEPGCALESFEKQFSWGSPEFVDQNLTPFSFFIIHLPERVNYIQLGQISSFRKTVE